MGRRTGKETDRQRDVQHSNCFNRLTNDHKNGKAENQKLHHAEYGAKSCWS